MYIRVIILSFLDVTQYYDHDCDIYDRFVTAIMPHHINVTVVTVICNVTLFFFTKFKIRKEISLLSLILTLPLFQDFSSRKTDFYLCQFLFSFLRYSFLNFLSFHLYSIFAMYFSVNSLFLKSHSSATFNFFYFLTSILVFLSKSITTSFAFHKSFSFSYILYSAINSFQCTKYLVTILICLFDIFFIFYSSSLLTFTDFGFSTLYFFTSSLYFTT